MTKPVTKQSSEIRKDFIAFFRDKCGHSEVASSSVIPHDDPTLLFTNAGMNQFKDVFLGLGKREYTRAVDTQKCIRAGGKHNDLEDVGTDTYHHTFFEMLGNWSFGDYFKAEAIQWAWELFTDVWGLDKSRLYVTVFEGNEDDGLEADIETESLWKELTDIDPSHITRWGKKDNFWEMGDTGPCGPCCELHYDSTPDGNGGHLVNLDDPNVIELWNLVFIQFNRGEDGSLTPLPNQHVDTGMGFERITRVLQGKTSNYDTDLWTPIFERIQSLTGAAPYAGSLDAHIDIAYRVIADHIRCLVVALADGGRAGAAGREYVLRRILRRAVRHARQTFGVHEPFLCNVVPAVVETLGETFPEIANQQTHIESLIKDEEFSFLKTLDRGLELFDKAVSEGDGITIDAKNAFELHDTFGFPIDLTEVMAEERGLVVDRSGYEQLMEEARETSRATSATERKMNIPPDVLSQLEENGVLPSDDSFKHVSNSHATTVLAIWDGQTLCDSVNEKQSVGVILKETPFYAEAGGQVGDRGALVKGENTFVVHNTHKQGDYILHIGECHSGSMTCGMDVEATVCSELRDQTEKNHTTTHLLNHSLRHVLGEDVHQRGSLVDEEKLRFDFSHGHAVTDKQLHAIEQEVNGAIEADLAVHAKVVPLDDAMRICGLRAVFGERYPDPVRVVSIGEPVDQLLENPSNQEWMNYSIEFCGGTHLQSSKQAEHFAILHEQALASGVRRMTAVTGTRAKEVHNAGSQLMHDIEGAKALQGESLVEAYGELVKKAEESALSQTARHSIQKALQQLFASVKKVQKSAASSLKEGVLELARVLAESEDHIVVGALQTVDKDSIMSALDAVRSKKPDGAVLLLGQTEEGKVLIAAGVSKPMIDAGLKAGDWVKEAASVCGGGGGGRPDTAQAGGRDPNKIPEAVEAAKQFAMERAS
ncbi:MAG: alanine--tRNA ligase [Phycisphaerae bacterium]|nr:alanine--tRNA ligase [Phycisphaerae bacterium]